jgi:serine-type D-Ala-D-Ala carboxypeptidase (penicillin-binding protein 5/6)
VCTFAAAQALDTLPRRAGDLIWPYERARIIVVTLPLPRTRRRSRSLVAGGIIAVGVLVLAAGITWALVAASRPTASLGTAPWPTTGTAALAVGDAEAGSPGSDEPRPIASIAKLVTALVVLDAAPLSADSDGPVYVLDADDMALAEQSRQRGDSFTPAAVGDLASERELLEQSLVASSNNAAVTLARRVFGTEGAYVDAARAWLDAHGLSGIRIADATGLGDGNLASASDLLDLGRIALADPVVAGISALPAAVSPDGTATRATNPLLGQSGIVGLKTGHTDAAGYAMLFATGGDRPIIGVVLGEPSATQRTTDVTRLVAYARTASR